LTNHIYINIKYINKKIEHKHIKRKNSHFVKCVIKIILEFNFNTVFIHDIRVSDERVKVIIETLNETK